MKRARDNSGTTPEPKVPKAKKLKELTVLKQDTNAKDGSMITQCTAGDNCTYTQKVYRPSNFDRHVRSVHKDVYARLGLQRDAVVTYDEPAISVRMGPLRMITGMVRLVTVHGLPFAAMDWEGIRELTEPVMEQHDLKINRHNITDYLDNTAIALTEIIRNEVHNEMLSLKIDIVSKMYRSFIGINCQFVTDNSAMMKRTLGVIELMQQHTAEHLRDQLLVILGVYGISLEQVFSVTIDNAANMVKMSKLLSKILDTEADEQEVLEEVLKHTLDSSDVVYEDTEEEELLSDAEESQQLETWVTALESSMHGDSITTVRCGAHTAQLVAHDACKPHITTLKSIRAVVKKVRLSKYKPFFEMSESGTYPPLPNETRWGSDYRMLSALHGKMPFFSTLGKQFPELAFTEWWPFIQDYCEAFRPLDSLTKSIQKLETTLSDFFIQWIGAYGQATSLPESNRFKNDLLCSMKTRQTRMFDNMAMLSAIYLDPRLHFNGSLLLSTAQKQKVVVYLLRVWDRINALEDKPVAVPVDVPIETRAESDDGNTDRPGTSNASAFNLNEYRTNTIGGGIQTAVEETSLEATLRAVQFCSRVDAHPQFSIHQYWASKKCDSLQLWRIAKVVFSVAATQCSIERDFSLFNAIFTKARSNLGALNIANIMLVKTNQGILKQAVAQAYSELNNTSQA